MILTDSLGLFSWSWGVMGAIFMFLVFLGLIVALVMLMKTGKKKD